MKGCFWNSGGFRDTAKHLMVSESFRNFKLDFFAVIETGRDNFTAPFLRNLAGGLDVIWYCVPPQGRSGGILVGFNNLTIIVKKVVPGDRCVMFHLVSNSDKLEW